MTSASCSVSSARSVMSFKLPMGVATNVTVRASSLSLFLIFLRRRRIDEGGQKGYPCLAALDRLDKHEVGRRRGRARNGLYALDLSVVFMQGIHELGEPVRTVTKGKATAVFQGMGGSFCQFVQR